MSRDEFTLIAAKQLAAHVLATQLELLSFDLSSETNPLSEVCQGHHEEATRTYTVVRDIIRGILSLSRELREKAGGLEGLMARLKEGVVEPLHNAGDTSSHVPDIAELVRCLDKIIADANALFDDTIDQLAGLLSSRSTGMSVGGPSSETSSVTVAKRTVISVDLSQYGRLSMDAEDILGPEAVFGIKIRIRELIQNALEECGLGSDSIIIDEGDGATIIVDPTVAALQFAEKLHLSAQRTTYTVRSEKNEMHFRIGIATGLVAMKGRDVSGTVIARAVRLQSAAATGEVIVCRDTWGGVPDGELQESYKRDSRKIPGKSHEPSILAFIKAVVSPAIWDK